MALWMFGGNEAIKTEFHLFNCHMKVLLTKSGINHSHLNWRWDRTMCWASSWLSNIIWFKLWLLNMFADEIERIYIPWYMLSAYSIHHLCKHGNTDRIEEYNHKSYELRKINNRYGMAFRKSSNSFFGAV